MKIESPDTINKTKIKSEKFLDIDGIYKTYYYYKYNESDVYEWRRFDGTLDSPDDLPALIYPHRKVWYYRGVIHRINNPAIIDSKGNEAWYFQGNRHRNDGPAVINGIIKEYWWKGKMYSFEKWCKLATKSKDEIAEIIIHYR